MDLPRDLRNRIYALAVWQIPYTYRNGIRDNKLLLSTPRKTGRALSQVSRSVRAESMGVYYSQTQLYCCIAGLKDPSADRIQRWLSTWGTLAVPSIRRLDLNCVSCCAVKIELGNSDNTSVHVIPWQNTRLSKQQLSGIENVVRALLFPGGQVEMTGERLVALLMALRKLPRGLS